MVPYCNGNVNFPGASCSQGAIHLLNNRGLKFNILSGLCIVNRAEWFWSPSDSFVIYTCFEKGCRTKVHTTIRKGNMGDKKHTFSWHCSCHIYFSCFPFALANIPSVVSPAILSNFFEKQWTQNHPQYLSGLSRALFQTTFLEIAVYMYTWFNEGWFGHWPMALWEAIVWWSLKQIIGVSSLWPNAQLLMINNILKATFIK